MNDSEKTKRDACELKESLQHKDEIIRQLNSTCEEMMKAQSIEIPLVMHNKILSPNKLNKQEQK